MPDDLTDNEKAATFIGWDSVPCQAKPILWNDKWFCDQCKRRWRKGELRETPHAGLCPDMSRPENYMRALEELSKFGDWCMGRSGVSLGPFLLNGKRIGPFEATTIESGGLVKAIPKALAALYDKEHEND